MRKCARAFGFCPAFLVIFTIVTFLKSGNAQLKEPNHALVRALRAERQKQKISQLNMAIDLNMTERNFIYWESQQRTPNFLALIDWADILGFDVELKKRVG